MPEKTPRDRGARLVDALILWIVPDHDAPGRKAGAILARRLFRPSTDPGPYLGQGSPRGEESQSAPHSLLMTSSNAPSTVRALPLVSISVHSR